MLPSRGHFQGRAGVAALAAFVAVGVRCVRPPPPERTLPGLAAALGAAVQGTVRTDDIVWEASTGPLSEMGFGRPILFLAGTGVHGERDLYRARVRVTPEGQPIEVSAVHDLTETPLGDDSGLEVNGANAVFATTAFGRVQGVTVLALDGVAKGDRPTTLGGRLLLGLSGLRRTGSFGGFGRTDVVFDPSARAARIALEPARLRVDAEDPDETVTVDLGSGEPVVPANGGKASVRVVRQDYRGRSGISWAVDVLRSYVGQAPVARIEDAAFGARDVVKRLGSKLFAWSATARPKAPGKEPEPPRVLSPSAIADDSSGFPPPPIPSLWEAPKPGEGQWAVVTYPFLPKLPGDAGKAAPPYFATTFIRPDPDRPYAEVVLVAMDMRQLELGMEGGYEEPAPVTGPPGSGRIPRDPSVFPRVAAAFNGAFKAEHGSYGMMVERRLLLPPVEGGATVAVLADGSAAFGTWPQTKDTPDDVVSFRQNLDPLVEGGVVNPAGRHIWGFQIEGESTETERTAVCLTRAGHVYYAWGHDISGTRLARALAQVGCDYAVHLDMNPRHCGFVFMNGEGFEKREAHFALADPRMDINPSRYVLGSDKDFFYVMVRNPSATSDPSGRAYTVSAGAQPPPAWLPAIHEAEESIGELSLRIVEFDSGRVDWVLRSGTDEPSASGARSKKIGLEQELEGRVMAAVGLGRTTDALRYGLSFGGQASLELRQSYATVVLSPGRALRIFAPGERPALAPTEDAVQLPLLADGATLNPRTSDRGGSRDRGAMCVTADGRVLVALGHHDSNDPLASALLESGCRRIVALDRGSRHPAFVARAGTDAAPLDRYETSVLYAVGRPMTPHAGRLAFPGLPDSPPGALPLARP